MGGWTSIDPYTFVRTATDFPKPPVGTGLPDGPNPRLSQPHPPPTFRIALGPRIPAPKAPSDEGAVKRLFEAS